MNLQLIAGPSGAGKSTYIYQKIIDEAQKNPKKHYLILVPIQYSMETQRILVFMSPKKSIMNIDVLSFERLAYRVFDELGTKKTVCLDETGKVLLLRRAASLIQDDLGILKRNIGRRGYIDEVKSLVSELMQYGYTPDDVGRMSESDGIPTTFKEKASDVEKLYRKFLTLFDESMFTQEQVLTLLCDVADRSELIRDSVIVLDGYTGFTPVQKELLRRIFPLVDSIYACVTCDKDTDLYTSGDEDGLFHMSQEESSFLSQMAGDRLSDPVFIDRGNGRFHGGDAMSFLEENILRENGRRYEGDERAVELIRVRDIDTEILYTAEKIHQIIREDDSLHYRDIAVVCPDVETYRYSFERIFDATGIPVFMDERRQTLFNPLTEFIDAALDMVKRRLSYESLMRFLRCGLTPLSQDETDILDNYLYEASFKSTTYLKQPFKRHTQDFRTDDDFAQVNAIREKISDIIMRFYDAEKGRGVSVRDRLIALFDLLSAFDAERKLNERAEAKEADGDMVSGDLYRRLFGFFCDLSDQMVSLLGDETMSVSDFRDMILDGLDAVKPATVPKSNDTVIFGDLERTRLSDVKVLFLIGAGDDQIPKSQDAIGIFSQEERNLLRENGFELSPTDRQRSMQQKFYLYLAMTKATQKLFITCHAANADGDDVGESYLYDEIRRLFPGTKTQDIDMSDPVFLETENSADIILTRGLRNIVNSEVDPTEQNLTTALLEVKTVSGREDRRKAFTDAAFFKNQKTPLQQAVTWALYGKSLTMSVSRLETFARCAYSYFCQYGLGLLPRQKNEFASLDLGNLYHGTLEKYARGLRSDGLTWDGITDDERIMRLKNSFNEELGDFSDTEIFQDSRESHFSDQAFNNLLLNTSVMTEQIRAGSFVPSFFEMELERLCSKSDLTVPIGNGRTLSLTGKIDRIDIASTGAADYIKIIDYKTGKNVLDPVRIYAGIQLQLLVYMNAALTGLQKRSRKKVLPAAVFYYMLKDSRIDEKSPISDQALFTEIEKDLRPSGLMVDDSVVVSALDSKLVTEESYYSPYVALNTVKGAKLGSSGSLVTPDEFRAVADYTRDKAASLGTQIANGITDISPYRDGDNTACKYCIYKGICHFDPRLHGFYYRDITHSLSDDTGSTKKNRNSELKILIERVSAKEETK